MWGTLLSVLISFLGPILIDWLKDILTKTKNSLDEKSRLEVIPSSGEYLDPVDAENMFWDEAEIEMERDFKSRRFNLIARVSTIPRQRKFFNEARKVATSPERLGKFASIAWHDNNTELPTLTSREKTTLSRIVS